MGKLRTHSTRGVSTLAKEVVKIWKDVIEENKRKRKRDDGDDVKKEDGAKKVKAEGGLVLSAVKSPNERKPFLDAPSVS